jgi:hypothetical protein
LCGTRIRGSVPPTRFHGNCSDDAPLSSAKVRSHLQAARLPVRFAQWSALVVPTGTLRAAATKIAADSNVRQVIAKAGSPIEYLDAPEFQTYWDADAAEMTKAVRAVGKVESSASTDDSPRSGYCRFRRACRRWRADAAALGHLSPHLLPLGAGHALPGLG